jgi:uncharacterized membrane protein
MRTPASIHGHPIHPMLVPIAIGGFVLSFAFDITGIFTPEPERWTALALYSMYGGIVGALVAAIPGLVDLVSLPAGPIRQTAIAHMVINLTVVMLFLVNAWLRVNDVHSFPVPISLSLVAILLLVVSGWLGGKLVHAYGVGVAESPVLTRAPLSATHE